MKRLLLLSGLIYVLLMLGLATINGEFIALAIPCVFYLAAAMLSGPQKPRLQATRTLSADRVSKGTPVIVGLQVTNHGAYLEEVIIEDLIPQSLNVIEGEPQLLTMLSPGQTVDLEYSVSGKRGDFHFTDVKVTMCDHLGLFRRQVLLPTPAQLLVLPEISRLKRVAIRPLQTHGFAGPIPARQGGSGVDFFGIREYQSGDPQRWINWRLSARHPRSFFTNVFEQERIADVGLILDARQRSEIRLRGCSLFDHAVHATASLAEAFINDGNRVGLLVYGGFLDWIFPGYGKVQRERILRALARAEPGESLIFENLDYIPTRFFPARSQIVLVSPLCTDDIPILMRLKARGYQILVISQDPIAFEVAALDPQSTTRLATRIAHLERTLLIRKLQRAGIQIVDWQVDRPLSQAIHSSLRRLPHWFRTLGLELRT